MIRSLSALVFAALPAAALASSFAATPVTTPSAPRILASDISWACGPDACLGSTDESRPLVLCQDLASRAGRLTSFVTDGRAFTPAQLDKCNAKARGAAPLARAN
ncbi:MAG: hypothetical protein ABIQ98_00695 [Sphingomicrobium sp.]